MQRTLGVSLIGFAVTCFALAGCRPEMTHNIADQDTAIALADYEIGAPLTHGNLTIFPVASKEARTDDRFITLDEGLKAGTVEVFEMGAENGEGIPTPPNASPNDAPSAPELPNVSPEPYEPIPSEPAIPEGGCEETLENGEEPPEPEEQTELPPDVQVVEIEQQLDNEIEFQQGNFAEGGGREVNRLMVVNNSDKPLYLMPGEIIIGGSQDRTIGTELVIAPTGKPVPIDVFCVEQQRWNDRAVEETVEELTVASQGALGGSIAVEGEAEVELAAQEIAKGKFIASVGNLNKAARLELQQSGEQGKVWEKVAVQNAATMVADGDATFSANYSNEEFVVKLEPYIKDLQKPVAEHENVVGVIVAVNGQVESMDMFESTPLFKKLWPKLLKSYALDAATHAVAKEKDAKESSPAEVTIADARAFFTKAARGEVTKEDKNGELAVTHRAASDVVCFTSRQVFAVGDTALPAAAEAAPQMDAEMDAFGGVHTSAFAH